MKKNLYSLCLIGLIFLASCGGDDPLPAPEATIVNPGLVEVGVPVMFDNLSLKASRYEWDFGSGSLIEEAAPTITFNNRGTVRVKLTAYTDDGQSTVDSLDIDVLERFMTDFVINSFAPFNAQGLDWDDNTGQPDSVKLPDIVVQFGPSDDTTGENTLFTPTLVDLDLLEVPQGFTISQDAGGFVLTPEEWTLIFIDVDDPSDEPADIQLETMAGVGFTPVNFATEFIDEQARIGFVQVAFGLYSVSLFFELR